MLKMVFFNAKSNRKDIRFWKIRFPKLWVITVIINPYYSRHLKVSNSRFNGVILDILKENDTLISSYGFRTKKSAVLFSQSVDSFADVVKRQFT